jgi:hypothetical protein
MSLTKLSLVIYKLFPSRESLENDIPAGDGNIEKLFYGVGVKSTFSELYLSNMRIMVYFPNFNIFNI